MTREIPPAPEPPPADAAGTVLLGEWFDNTGDLRVTVPREWSQTGLVEWERSPAGGGWMVRAWWRPTNNGWPDPCRCNQGPKSPPEDHGVGCPRYQRRWRP